SKYYKRYIKWIYLCGDILILNISFLLAYYLRFHEVQSIFSTAYLQLFAFFNTLWLGIAYLTKPYDISRLDSYTVIAKKLLRPIIWHFATVTSAFVLLKLYSYSRYQLVLFYLIFATLVILWRETFAYFLKIYRRLGYNQSNIIIVGYNRIGLKLYNFFQNNPEKGYRFMGFFDRYQESSLVKGDLKAIEAYAIENDIDEIFCSADKLSKKYIQQLKQFADDHLKRIKFIPNFENIELENAYLEQYGDISILLARKEPLNDHLNQVVKRSFDIVFSLAVIVLVLSWLIPLLAIIIYIDSKGPVFFKQTRSGKNHTTFTCWKLRTMRYEKNSKFIQATKNDNRITRVGKLLRKTNLDELPQFFNVLLGDMTVVGPRPHPLELNETFKNVVEKYMVRHLVKPGVTG
ncbi:MAG: exopolysaccharide biosynthesis polyprenyl glycosylphosphotransferase, partial [Bacteroidota bacterium]